MKLIVAVLVVGAFFFNFSYRWMSEGTRFTPWAMWYIQQGLWVALLGWVLFAVLWDKRATLTGRLALGGAAIAGIEGLVTALPRLLVTDPTKVPAGKPLVDYVTGLPMQAMLITCYLLTILCILTWRTK